MHLVSIQAGHTQRAILCQGRTAPLHLWVGKQLANGLQCHVSLVSQSIRLPRITNNTNEKRSLCQTCREVVLVNITSFSEDLSCEIANFMSE